MKSAEKISPSDFFASFTPETKVLVEEVLQEGFVLTMVGGAVRDFFLTGSLPSDIDLELRLEIDQEEEDWKKTLFVLGQKLKDRYEVEHLPFGILRIRLQSAVIEFSSPRLESYEGGGPWGHSDFKAILSSSYTHEESFRRRDFTINAIGIEFRDFSNFKLCDPYKGIEDLAAGILRPCGDDFYKDPVRFLRLIRMEKTFDFALSPDLMENLQRFDLSLLKFFHVSQEAFKSGFSTFISCLFELSTEKKIKLNEDILLFKSFLNEGFSDDRPENFTELFVAKVFSGQRLEPENALERLSGKVGMKQHFLSQLYEFKKVLLAFSRYPLKKFRKELSLIIQEKQWQEILGDEHFALMERFCFYHRRLLTLKQNFLNFFPKEIQGIYEELCLLLPPDLKGEEEFIELIQTAQVPQEFKSVLRIYAHLRQAKTS